MRLDPANLPPSIAAAHGKQVTLRQCYCSGGKVNERCPVHGAAPTRAHIEQLATDLVSAAVRAGPAQPAPLASEPEKRAAYSFVIHGAPIGKPRMTQRDKWKKRPCVVRYRAWADKVRAGLPPGMPVEPISVSWIAYLPLPKSWRKPLQDAMRGQLHRHKPDRDNIDKAVLDVLLKNDAGVAQGTLEKRWDDGNGPRIEITITTP